MNIALSETPKTGFPSSMSILKKAMVKLHFICAFAHDTHKPFTKVSLLLLLLLSLLLLLLYFRKLLKRLVGVLNCFKEPRHKLNLTHTFIAINVQPIYKLVS